jgi:hypothetical protein
MAQYGHSPNAQHIAYATQSAMSQISAALRPNPVIFTALRFVFRVFCVSTVNRAMEGPVDCRARKDSFRPG